MSDAMPEVRRLDLAQFQAERRKPAFVATALTEARPAFRPLLPTAAEAPAPDRWLPAASRAAARPNAAAAFRKLDSLVKPTPVAEAEPAPRLDVVASELAEAARLAEANARYERELAAAVEQARGLVRTLDSQRAIDTDALAGGLRALVTDLVEQVIEAQLSVDPGFVDTIVRRALDELKDRFEPAELKLNPDDVALVDAETTAPYTRLRIVADAGVPRGAARLVTSDMTVSDGGAHRIGQIEAALAKVA